MNRHNFLVLLNKYNKGEASQAEVDFIMKYYELFDALPNEVSEDSPLQEEILRKLMEKIHEEPAIVNYRSKRWRLAASVILVISSLFVSWYYIFRPHSNFKNQPIVVQHDVPPATKRAQLILDNGKTINLDEQKKGLLTIQNNVQVTKTEEGNLNFQSTANDSDHNPTRINQLITPQGGQYTLQLSDGSKVWLNAASRFSFPADFSGDKRVVELDGEAFFEVTHHTSKPFIVKAKDTEIVVLGTQFNITAYHDEGLTKTTLIDGAVRVNHNNMSRELKAGLQAITMQDSPIQVKSIDVKEATAWKDGYFYFKDESLDNIMRQLQRWYNIEVVYHPKVNKTQTFGGIISNKNHISNILSLMELTEGIHFKIEGRRVTVMP